ncbi:ABC transporter ATP-binding protein [Halalkalibacter krulwichiae]|uniref:High-affinity branched-chain amino acid transport ATP-binding protein LivF n=1 Tax=Halalkalibacter krulwichiae TaxID=199441 RepID=A0A1X9M614_9BACI|nr:ABC transporter ATP-binding protein [Halalkalibacter krulwichiae]ARK28888.1 High-affinity branched-chain amino acid transport ATP-binding protein LivF [Halalkalibacter krulwichiae]
MLDVQNLHSYYGESHILHDVSLQVKKGSVSVLLGRNGMGKTTTLHSIMGMVPPKKGKVVINGREIQGQPSYQVSKAGIGLVPQGRRIFPNLTVKENLLTTYRPVKDGWNLTKIYDMFPRLKERETSMGGNLSGGEQQMLSIGRALMTNPELLLLDEPSEGLSPLMVREVIKIIKTLKEDGLSMLLVEQNLSMASDLADHVYILNKGSVVFDGSSDEFDVEVRNKFLSLSS